MTDPWTTEETPDAASPDEALTRVLSPMVLLGLALGCFIVDQTLLLVGWSIGQAVPGLLTASILGVFLPVWATCRMLALPLRSAIGLRALGAREVGWVVWGVGSIVAPAYAAGALGSHVFPPSHEMFQFYEAIVPETVGAIVLGGLGVVVIGPLAEEIVFRGLVLGALLRLAPVWAAIVTAAVLFAGSHGAPWMLVPIALLGVVLGGLVWRTGKLTSAWLGHGLFNLIAYVDVCLTHDVRSTRLERWSLQPWVLGVSLASLVIATWVFVRSRPVPAFRAEPRSDGG